MDTDLMLNVGLSDQVDQETQIKVAASILGYKKLPPDIRTFVTDPYYLGEVCADLYPFWLEKLELIYPSPIHTNYPFIVSHGGIGTGKSTFSRILAEYTRCRLDHLKNPHRTFKMMPGKYIDFNFFSYTNGLAHSEFIDVLSTWDQLSPYFSSGRLSDNEGISLTADGPRGNNAISKDIIYYNLSELNFVKPDKAFEKLNNAFKRYDSRFGRFKDYFGHIILDSSSKGDDGVVDQFINSNPYGDQVLVIRTNQWLVREHLGYYGQAGWIEVYAGDSINQPYIIDEDHPKKDNLDPDRIIKVPKELEADFRFDLITALQDKAGISTSTSDRLFPNNHELLQSFVLPFNSPDVVKFDFYDKTDKLIYRFDPVLRLIPDDKVIYIRYDIGVVSDNCGLAICYFDGWKIFDKDKKVKHPKYAVPMAVGINRNDGEETSIFHLEEFVYDLNNRFEIGCFSADQFASRQLLQDLNRDKIPSKYISVDRTDEAYIYLKTQTNAGLVKYANNGLLKTELSDLRHIGTKVDHTATGCFVGYTKIIVKSKCKSYPEVRFLRDLEVTNDKYQVLTYNEVTHKVEFSDIKAVAITKIVTELIKIDFFSGNSYQCTPEHLFLTDKGWMQAKDLTEIDDLVSTNDFILSISRVIVDPIPVYDLETVSENHNFCLSNGVVVHNSKDIADAVCGAVFSCYQDLEHASQLSNKYKAEAYTRAVQERSASPQDTFTNMIQSIY